MKLGEIIKKYREEHGLSQREFAKKAGLSPTYIWYVEQDKHPQTGKPINPSLPSLSKIARALDMALDELMAQCKNMLIAISDEDDERDVFYAMFSKLDGVQKEAVLAVMQSFIK